MARDRKPRLYAKEVERQIFYLTGVPVNAIQKVLQAYEDIIDQSLKAGVEVAIGDKCTLIVKHQKPLKNKIYRNPRTGEFKPPVNVPGYLYPALRPTKHWKDEIREATLNWGEEQNEEKEDGDAVQSE